MQTTVTEKDGPNYGALPAELAADSSYLLEGGLYLDGTGIWR